ncbi:MAG: DUF2188 domain-containing protein [Myxococcota bacterium]
MTIDLEKLPAIRNLSEDVRQKALEFAGALGARGPRPTTTLGTAVTLAQEWKSGRLPTKQGGPAVLVQPRNGRWIIRRADSEHATHTFQVREDAVRRAQDLARRYATACLVFGPGGSLIERYGAPGSPAAAAEVPPIVEPVVVVAAPPEPVVVAAEAVVAAEPVVVAEPVIIPEPIIEAIAVEPIAVEPTAIESVVEVVADEPEPVIAVTDLEAAPIRVKRMANKWAVVLGDGRTESFHTKQKAHKRAKDLAAALGCAVVLA